MLVFWRVGTDSALSPVLPPAWSRVLSLVLRWFPHVLMLGGKLSPEHVIGALAAHLQERSVLCQALPFVLSLQTFGAVLSRTLTLTQEGLKESVLSRRSLAR